MAEHVIDQAIAAVADRVPVDWNALEHAADSDENRNLLDCLRVLGGLADLHRALDADVELSGAGPPMARRRHHGAGHARRTKGDIPIFRAVSPQEKVGQGGFGTVYLGWDPDLELEVAIKILDRRVPDAKLKEALLGEGRRLARVRHPHVVRVLAVESQQDQIALCMEFVRGQTLEDIIQRDGPMAPRQAAVICQDVCGALAAVHLAGFVHRDVKSRNVMQERGGRVVLMDFGAGEKTQPNNAVRTNMVGTPLYMAPGVLAGQAATTSSDVYSVGVLLYYLVTAEYPVEGNTFEDICAAHMQGQRRLLSERRPARDPRPARMVPATLHALGRSAFANDSLRDWFVVGLRSSLAPTVLLLVTFAVASLFVVARRLLVTMSRRVQKADVIAERWLKRAAHGLRLDDQAISASLALLLSTTLVLGAWWYFQDLLAAMGGPISTTDVGNLRLLAPDQVVQHAHGANRKHFHALSTGTKDRSAPIALMVVIVRLRN